MPAAPVILLIAFAVFTLPYAALIVLAHAVAAWRGHPWTRDELRRRQAPLLVATVAAAALYAAYALITSLAHLLT
ncbi:hypothetical protein [Kitasatospora griseola]|uniref:hypothetical protein n=1 Tax=Kitasatospora griseola TaxID=2064 RepID=UPI0016702046|nr:hypothetical protein [Kitasatospora griseola]GGR04324.1 hypothetical protein GCM10010195_69760 [Kitasatospora griseola]